MKRKHVAGTSSHHLIRVPCENGVDLSLSRLLPLERTLALHRSERCLLPRVRRSEYG
jgi:hypothetical protein